MGNCLMRQVRFRRLSDGHEFVFGLRPPYQLTPKTVLPDNRQLELSGVEFAGTNGGVTLASRYQRATVKISYNILESLYDERSQMQLTAALIEFFQPMQDDLTANKFDMFVTTGDKLATEYRMRNGSVTVPPAVGLVRGLGLSVNNEIDLLFDDPYLYYTGSAEQTITLTPPPAVAPFEGEQWLNGLQNWVNGLSQWIIPAKPDTSEQDINVETSVTVGAEFTVSGLITNPVITNVSNGSSWVWVGTLSDGDTIIVDMDGNTSYNGRPLLSAYGGITLRQGINRLKFDGTNSNNNAKAVIKVTGAF